MNQYEQYLQKLPLLHYVVGALALVCACTPINHLIVGIILLVNSLAEPSTEVIPFIFGGALFTIIASAIIIGGWTFGICLILAGRFIAIRTHYTFCLGMAGLACLFIPFGTMLGIFAIVLLAQPQVRAQFEGQPAPPELVSPS